MARKKENNYSDLQNELNRQIREKDLGNLYLICGDQDYLRTQNRDKLKEALLDGADPMNCSVFTGSEFTVEEVKDLAETLPFFAERRVILIEDSFLLPKASNEASLLAQYLPNMPDTTAIVFVSAAIDNKTELVKTIRSFGFVMECGTPDPASLRKWAAGLLKATGRMVYADALDLFLEYTGEDMLNIKSEAAKLSAFCDGRDKITREDVESICCRQVRDRIFDMITAIVSKDPRGALSIYMDLVKLQTKPQVILALMIRQYTQLLHITDLKDRGAGVDEIAARLHFKSPYIIKAKLLPLANRYSEKDLEKALQLCVGTDMDYKSGKIGDKLAVERLIIRCCAGL